MYRFFKAQPKEIAHEMNWTCLWRGKLKWENESLWKAAQSNALRTNAQIKIDKGQKNCKCRSGSDRNEIVNYIKGECSKLAQKEYNIWLSRKSDPLGTVQKTKV